MAGVYRLHRQKEQVVAILVRVPPSVKNRLEREARQREISVSKHIANLLSGERDTWVGPEPDDFEFDNPREEYAAWER